MMMMKAADVGGGSWSCHVKLCTNGASALRGPERGEAGWTNQGVGPGVSPAPWLRQMYPARCASGPSSV